MTRALGQGWTSVTQSGGTTHTLVICDGFSIKVHHHIDHEPGMWVFSIHALGIKAIPVSRDVEIAKGTALQRARQTVKYWSDALARANVVAFARQGTRLAIEPGEPA